MAMIKCKTCGKTISDSENKCPFCGDKIMKLVCPKCGCTDIGIDVKVGEDVNAGWFFIGLLPMLIIKWFNRSDTKCVCRACGKRFKVK